MLLLLALHSISCSFDVTQQLPVAKIDLYQEKIILSMPQQPVPIERGLALKLRVPDGVNPQLSVVEGVSMAMGRIPVQWEPAGEPNQWLATLYLGACTEPQMEWRMLIPLQHNHADLPKSVSFTFMSER